MSPPIQSPQWMRAERYLNAWSFGPSHGGSSAEDIRRQLSSATFNAIMDKLCGDGGTVASTSREYGHSSSYRADTAVLAGEEDINPKEASMQLVLHRWVK